MSDVEKPIGYWLKELDRLIEASFERTLTDLGLSRRHWQTLNTLSQTPGDEHALSDVLRPFLGDGAITLDEVTGDLLNLGWAERGGDGRYRLTASGRAAHAALLDRINVSRRRILDGLTPEEYQATVRVLRRMAGNLEASLAA
jgi:hypothetical protein